MARSKTAEEPAVGATPHARGSEADTDTAIARSRRAFARSTTEGGSPGWSLRLSLAAMAAIVLLSLGAHLWGLTGDLPMPEVDERYFITPATYIAARGDLNPHWFGHPGSTVIYPLAAAFRLREV